MRSDVQKPTKAQKRRELREKEEAEREARIAEEQANLGPSARETEAVELAQVLEPLGYEIFEIAVCSQTQPVKSIFLVLPIHLDQRSTRPAPNQSMPSLI